MYIEQDEASLYRMGNTFELAPANGRRVDVTRYVNQYNLVRSVWDKWRFTEVQGRKEAEARKQIAARIDGLSDKERKDRLRRLIVNRGADSSPQKKLVTSGHFERDYLLSEALKILRDNRCQICGGTFEMENGELYSEVHHVLPLSRGGPDVADNILVLCPTCHKKFHYASRSIVEGMATRLSDEVLVFLRSSNRMLLDDSE